MVKVPSETCVEREECLLPLESGEDGTEEATSSRRDTLSPLPLPPQLSFPSSKPEDTELTPSQNYPWLSLMLLRKLKEQRRQSDSSRMSEPGEMSRKSSIPSKLEPEKASLETEDTDPEEDLWSSIQVPMSPSSRL